MDPCHQTQKGITLLCPVYLISLWVKVQDIKRLYIKKKKKNCRLESNILLEMTPTFHVFKQILL